MAMPGKITQEEVNAICAKLRSQGKRPSTRLIRAEHGSGSTGTIQQMLRVWEAENPDAETGVSLTTALQKALADNLGYEVTRAKQELGGRLESAQETIGDLIRENEVLAEENAQILETNTRLVDSLAELHGKNQQLESDTAAARAAEQSARDLTESLRVEVARSQLRIEQADKLQESHAKLHAQYEEERSRREAAEKLAGVNGAQRDAMEERFIEEKARSVQLNAQVDQLTKELTTAAVRVEASHGRLESAEYQLTAAREQSKKERETAARALAEASEWKGHAEELRTQLAKAAGPDAASAPR